MKSASRSILHRLAFALLGAWSLACFAQPAPPADNREQKAEAQAAKPDAPAAAAPAEASTPPAAEADKPGEEKPAPRKRPRRNVGSHHNPPFGDHNVTEGNRVHEAISVMGSTTVDGETVTDAVSVMGSTTVGPTGRVGGAAVAVMGRLEVQGEVGQDVVSVLGGGTINGRVGGKVVGVLGELELGPDAVVEGDIVSVGGTLVRDPKAIVRGNEVRVPFMLGKHDVEWLVAYVRNCVMLARPLAFGPHLGWAWLVALCFFAFYLLLALLFSKPLTRCVQTLETRPGASLLAAVLTVLLTPVAIVLLCFTVIGIVLVPFVVLGLMFATLFGKATMLAWIGRRFTRFFGDGLLGHIFFAVLVGGMLVLMLYTVPVLGFLLLKLLGWLGLGVVVYTLLLGMRRPKPAVALATPGAGIATPVTMPVAVAPVAPAPFASPTTESTPPPAAPGGIGDPATAAAAGFTPPIPPAVGAAPVPPPPPVAPQPAMPQVVPPQPVLVASTLPRAGFMIRLGALLLDVILVAVVTAFFSRMIPHWFHFDPPGMLPVLAVYGAVMWKLKGTTIGGAICGLKVVRIDNRPLDWPTAVVRALGCFLSFVVVGLGFLWVAIDDEKQSWHDKIAGTTVVYAPKGVALI